MTLNASLFSTTLKQVTGIFDRHGLVSAFFPNLIFWSATICLIAGEVFGWPKLLTQWEAVAVTAQVFCLIAFLAWATFCTFLTINFQSTLIRLYEGYWSLPAYSFIGQFGERRKHHYKQQWIGFRDRDDKLEQQQVSLILRQRQLSKPIEELDSEFASMPTPADFAAAERSFLAAIQAIAPTATSASEMAPLANLQIDDILPKAAQLQQQRQYWKASQALIQTSDDTQRWQQCKESANQLTRQIQERLDQLVREVEESRHRLNRQQFLYLPAQLDSILPTQLGNVMKAAELYSQHRYNIDAVLIWPRLQAFLPKDFASTLQDAKTSLDLMVTLSAFCMLFGLPLSVWLVLRAKAEFLAVVPFGFVLLAIAMRQKWIGVAALLASVISLLFRLFPATRMLPLIRLDVLLTLSAGILLVSRLSYENAVQAALSYGEQLKAAFDLYRWKALEGLNLKLPNNLKEERALWNEVCGLLYRGYSDGLMHYQYRVLAEGSNLESASPAIEQSLLAQREIVGIPATPAMVLGGELKVGMRIKLCFEDIEGTLQTIEDVLVVNVISAGSTAPMQDPGSAHTYVLIAAIPEGKMEKWQRRMVGGEILVVV